MGAVVRSPIYVPSPASEDSWLSKPKGTALVLLAALAPLTFFGAPGQSPPPKTWRYHQAEETCWQWQAPSRAVLNLATYRLFNRDPLAPTDEPAGWGSLPKPVPLVIALPPSVASPFVNTRRLNLEPESGWLVAGSRVSPLLQAVPPFTARATRQINFAEDSGWLGRPRSSPSVLQATVAPPFVANARRMDTHAESLWTGRSSRVSPALQAVPPFTAHVARKIGFAEDAFWLGRPRNSPALQILALQPTAPPFIAGRWKFNVAEDPPWTVKSRASQYLPQPEVVVIGALDNPEDFVLYTAEIELWFLTDRET